MIPYNHQFIDQDDINAVVKALKGELITSGNVVGEFESLVASYTHTKEAITFNSATSALYALSQAMLNEGDIVLTTPNSFVATSNAIVNARADVKFVDIDENGNLDLELCEKELRAGHKIRAIYIVAFAGVLYDYSKLKELKDRYNLLVVEDLAHAFGSKYSDGTIAGSCSASDASVFSFHAIKNITTAEGGMVVTNNLLLAKELRLIRSHYITKENSTLPWEYEQIGLGQNYRMSDISASLGISQFKKLEKFKVKIGELVEYYIKKLGSINGITPLHRYDKNLFYHLFVVLIEFNSITKERLFNKMQERGVMLQVNYIPIYKQPFYKNLLGDIELSNCERYYSRAVSLPLYYSLTFSDIDYIVSSLGEILHG